MNRLIEEQLTELGHHVEFPPTPPLALLVRPRLAASAARPRNRRPALLIAAAVGILALVLGVPPVRTAIAHWLGIQGVVISPSPVPSLGPHPSPNQTHSAQGVGANLHLGQISTIATSSQTVGFHVLVPQRLGPPDAVYIRTDLGPVVTLVYEPRAGLPASGQTGVGLLITEFRGATDPMLMQKFVTPETTVTPLEVNGAPGFWLGGAPHQLGYLLPDGSVAPDTLRLAGPTLVFERGAVTVRIEGNLTETAALAIAQQLS
jgi:hypothetical protein